MPGSALSRVAIVTVRAARACVDRVRLLLPERVALVPRLGGPHHAVDADLAADGHAQADAGHLVQQRDRLVWHVGDFEVAPSSAAFAGDALGDGVEGDERDVRVEHADDLLERGERVRVAGVDVHLVYLVREKDDVVLLAQLHEGLLLVEARTEPTGLPGLMMTNALGSMFSESAFLIARSTSSTLVVQPLDVSSK
jgi:hypothetical protein